VKTDSNGMYELAEVPTGQINVMFRTDKEQSGTEGTTFELLPNQRKQVDFDFRGYVQLQGTINYNNNSRFAENSRLTLNPLSDDEDKRYNPWGLMAGWNFSNNYVYLTKHGRYELEYSSYGGTFVSSTVAIWDIPEEPSTQTHDITFQTASAFVQLEFEGDTSMEMGTLEITQQLNGEVFAPNTTNIQQATLTLSELVTGTYKIGYKSRSKLYAGESDWVQIAPGNENIFVILVGENPDKESTLIARIQQALAKLGYNPGPIDGLWGGMTSGALLKFQEAESLPATGQINEATLEALGVD
jgi:hypothetical protein